MACLYFPRENLADRDSAIIPYKVLNRRDITLYGIIEVSLSADFLYARYGTSVFPFNFNFIEMYYTQVCMCNICKILDQFRFFNIF